MLNKQAVISRQINKSLIEKEVSSVSNCGNYCIRFTYNTNETEDLKIDIDNKLIKFGNYSTYLVDDSYFGNISLDILYSESEIDGFDPTYDKILKITIPIKHDSFKEEDFGLNIVYQFKDVDVTNASLK